MRDNGKMAPDVDLAELAVLTKNFSGAEIEGLVKAATSTAMNRLIKASSKVEVDPDAMEKLLVTRKDFMHALENDVKPVSYIVGVLVCIYIGEYCRQQIIFCLGFIYLSLL